MNERNHIQEIESSELKEAIINVPEEELPSDGLVFRNIQFSVKKFASYLPPKRKTINILKGVSSHVNRGTLCCILGPSGSGKTSLLDYLSFRLKSGNRKGQVYFKEKTLKASKFRRDCGYVMQHDILLGTETVKETLMFTAMMKLGSSYSLKEKRERVNTILQKFVLAECANVKIGNNMIRGISGGQRRRVSIAQEIINNPDLLLLDEPTSGLDSFTSAKIINILRTLAHEENKCIVATIHQPSVEIFQMFDQCIILAEGNIIYDGSPKTIIDDCIKIGYPCPARFNPADHIINLVSNPFIKPKYQETNSLNVNSIKVSFNLDNQTNDEYIRVNLSNTLENQEVQTNEEENHVISNMLTYLKYEDSHTSEELLHERTKRIEHIKNLFDNRKRAYLDQTQERVKSSNRFKPSKKPLWIVRFFILMWRNVRSTVRDPLVFWSEFIQYLFGAIFIGLLYWQPDFTPNGINDRIFSMLFIILGFSYVPALTAISTFPEHRELFNRERDSNLYGTLEYYLAYSVVHITLEIIFPVLCVLICYFMIGYHIQAHKIFIAIAALMLTQVASESFGLMVSSIVKTIDVGILGVTLILIIWQTFSGFMVRDVKWYFKPFQYTSVFFYGMNILVQNEFIGRPSWEAVDNNGNSIPGADNVTGEDVIKDAYPKGVPAIWINFVIMISFVLLYRIICYLLLRFKRMNKK